MINLFLKGKQSLRAHNEKVVMTSRKHLPMQEEESGPRRYPSRQLHW